MIKINLLPNSRRASAAAGGQTWIWWAFAAVALEEVVGLFMFFRGKQQELEDWQRRNKELDAQIQISKDKVKDQPELRKKLSKLRAREEAISRLQSARTGPAAMLLEVGRLLTKGRGPTVAPEVLAKVQSDNPLAMMNSNWDTRRLWLTEFIEQSRTVRLRGRAIDGEDVSELARRMSLSAYFYDVKLLPAQRSVDKEGTGLDSVTFQLEARVKY
jgi:type IV pilus assembly protein PilN